MASLSDYPQQNPTRFLTCLDLYTVTVSAKDAMDFGLFLICKRNVHSLQRIFLTVCVDGDMCPSTKMHPGALVCLPTTVSNKEELRRTQHPLRQIFKKIFFSLEAMQTWERDHSNLQCCLGLHRLQLKLPVSANLRFFQAFHFCFTASCHWGQMNMLKPTQQKLTQVFGSLFSFISRWHTGHKKYISMLDRFLCSCLASNSANSMCVPVKITAFFS